MCSVEFLCGVCICGDFLCGVSEECWFLCVYVCVSVGGV